MAALVPMQLRRVVRCACLATLAGLIVATTAGPSLPADLRLVRSTSGSRGVQQGSRYVIEDPRTVFSAAGDRQVIVLFEWEGPPGTYRCEGRWKDPSGKAVLVAPIEYQATSRRFGIYWTLALPESAARGLWALEASVEGQPAGTHTFQVTDSEAPGPGRRLPSAAEIYQRALASVATVERLGASGELLAQGPALALDADHVATSFRLIEAGSKLRLTTAAGFRGESSEVAQWDRRQGWAVLRFPGHGLAPLARSAAALAVGDRCFVLDTVEDGGRVITESSVVGREPSAPERPRLGSAFASGSPVLDESGSLAGMVVVGGREEELGPAVSLRLPGSMSVARGSLFMPPPQLPAAPAGGATLAELAGRGEFLRPLSADQRHVISGVFAARVERGGATPMPQDQRFVFSRQEQQVSVFVQWQPQAKKDDVGRFEVYDADYKLLGKSEPMKLKLRSGNYLFSTWTFHIGRLPPAVYRVDLLLGEAAVWRSYVRVTQ